MLINSQQNSTLSHENATCEISIIAMLLKEKVMHWIFHQEKNVTTNAIRLLTSLHTYLDCITTTLSQIYVRKGKILS